MWRHNQNSHPYIFAQQEIVQDEQVYNQSDDNPHHGWDQEEETDYTSEEEVNDVAASDETYSDSLPESSSSDGDEQIIREEPDVPQVDFDLIEDSDEEKRVQLVPQKVPAYGFKGKLPKSLMEAPLCIKMMSLKSDTQMSSTYC